LLQQALSRHQGLGHDYTARGEGEKAPPAFQEVDAMLELDDWFRRRFNVRLQSARCEHLLSQGALDEAEACGRRLLDIEFRGRARGDRWGVGLLKSNRLLA
jgi:hypothetical protein